MKAFIKWLKAPRGGAPAKGSAQGRGQRRARRGGFTLLEVLIAMVVLAVGLLGLFSLHEVALAASRMSSKMSAASMLARAQMEYLMGLDYKADGLAAVSPPTDLAYNGADPTTASDPYSPLPHPNGGSLPPAVNVLGTTSAAQGALEYFVTWNVDYPFAGDTSVLELTVRVAFQEGISGRTTHGVTITSYRYRDVPL